VPETWTAKEDRQYNSARNSFMPSSRGPSFASKVVDRPLSKQDNETGRVLDRRAAGTGNPRAPLEERSKDELYNLAEQHDVKGRSRMNKTQLITAIRRRNGSEL
jgi:hypothetical protein